MPIFILSRDWSVTIDGVWIDDRFIGLFDTMRDYTLQFTITHTVSTVTSSLPLLGSGFQRRTFTFL
jgi:hypothetical protein